MQKLVSQISELPPFLAKIPKHQHHEAIKHLIRLGLEATRSQYCKQNQFDRSNILRKELDAIKDNIQELNQIVKSHYTPFCIPCHQGQPHYPYSPAFQTEPRLNEQNTFGKNVVNVKNQLPRQRTLQQPVKDIPSALGNKKDNAIQVKPFAKRKPYVSHHHLDDRQVRQALQFPIETLLQTSVKLKRRSQDYKKHVYQQEINKEQLLKIKQQKGGSLQRSQRDRTVSDYTKTTSKIKPLLDKDRIRFMQKQKECQFKEGFNKYQYSDESQMEESSMKEQSSAKRPQEHQRLNEENTYNMHYQSSFKGSQQASSSQKSHQKTSSKKQFQRSKKEVSSKFQRSLGQEVHQERKSQQNSESAGAKRSHNTGQEGMIKNIDYEQEDVVSNSSSFSQFSIGGSHRKQVGKISRRSHQD